VYLVKSAAGFELVRVTRMRSTIDPRLGMVRGAAGSSGSSRTTATTTSTRGNGESGMLDDMRSAQDLNRALADSQVEIDLELFAPPAASGAQSSSGGGRD
jgi:hypothetical protein